MKIGESLVKENLLSQDQIKAILKEQDKTHDRLGDIALKMGFVTPEQMAPFLAKYFDIPYVKVSEIYKDIKPHVIDAIPADLAHRFNVIPIDLKDRVLTIAMFDPLDLVAIDTIKIKTGYKIQCVIASESDILEANEFCYHNLPRMKEQIENFIDLEVKMAGTDGIDRDVDGEDVSTFAASDQPVVQYVKSMIIQGVNNRASDIHVRPKQNSAELKFRIDGVLQPVDPPPKSMLGAITTRIKILSGLDIAEKRIPQDGRFRVKVGKNEIDIRVSSFPTIYGESVVMRLLNTSHPLLGLEQLGFSPEDENKFNKIINQAYGLVLVTGPTGSGKTTTLYTTLNEIKSVEKNILTLEDPVEYRLPFIQQTQVNPGIGFDFAKGLRSILRQDPDVILVGEIRDQETAEIAINAALTGHLVFATLHTNDASGAPVRLVKMGIEPFLITSVLLGVIAQRLIRIICPHCKESYTVDKSLLKRLNLDLEITHLYRGKGCSKCFNSGYLGREGIFELLVPDEEINRMILEKRSGEEVRAVAQRKGMRTLRYIGVEKLKNGLTTPEELLRVTLETKET